MSLTILTFAAFGYVWFLLICFHFGYFLAWAADCGGVVMAVARALVGTERLERNMRDLMEAFASIGDACSPEPLKTGDS